MQLLLLSFIYDARDAPGASS